MEGSRAAPQLRQHEQRLPVVVIGRAAVEVATVAVARGGERVGEREQHAMGFGMQRRSGSRRKRELGAAARLGREMGAEQGLGANGPAAASTVGSHVPHAGSGSRAASTVSYASLPL
jgi:hypothetical protein